MAIEKPVQWVYRLMYLYFGLFIVIPGRSSLSFLVCGWCHGKVREERIVQRKKKVQGKKPNCKLRLLYWNTAKGQKFLRLKSLPLKRWLQKFLATNDTTYYSLSIWKYKLCYTWLALFISQVGLPEQKKKRDAWWSPCFKRRSFGLYIKVFWRVRKAKVSCQLWHSENFPHRSPCTVERICAMYYR